MIWYMKTTERQFIASYGCIISRDALRLLTIVTFALLIGLPDHFMPACAAVPSPYELYQAGRTEEAKGIV